MHVLVVTPTWGDRLRPETVASVVGQRFTGRLTWQITRRNPYPPPDVRNVDIQYQRIREVFLAGEYDALWLVEHDMVIPPDALQKLCDTDAPVVYAPYMLRHGRPVLSAWRYENERNLGMSLSLYPAELKAAQRAGVVRTCGVGFGCTLIQRPVLEAIAFRGGEQPPDLPFAVDCLRANILALTRFDVACGHWHNGEVLMTEIDGGVVARVLANDNVNVKDGDEYKALVKGHYYSLGIETAAELARAGYVTITNRAEGESLTDNTDNTDKGQRGPREAARQRAVDPVKMRRAKRKAD